MQYKQMAGRALRLTEEQFEAKVNEVLNLKSFKDFVASVNPNEKVNHKNGFGKAGWENCAWGSFMKHHGVYLNEYQVGMACKYADLPTDLYNALGDPSEAVQNYTTYGELLEFIEKLEKESV